MSVPGLLRAPQPVLSLCRSLNCWTAAITKKHRALYEHTYPTRLVLADGSSITVDYHEPRKIIVLPIDLRTLSADQRKAREAKRIPKTKIKIVDDYEDDYKEGKYLNPYPKVHAKKKKK